MHLPNSTDARRNTMPVAQQANANPPAQAAANRIPSGASQPLGSDAAASRHRLTAMMGRLHLRSAWQSVLRRWSTSSAPVSFASLMQSHGGIDAHDANGKTLVEVALKSTLSNRAAIVAALKAEGADLALPDEDGNHLLHRTVLARDLAGVVILLSNQVDADATNRRTTPAITRYARSPAQMRAAMQAPNWTWGDDDNATALHLAAAFSNDPAMIDALARYATNIDAMTVGGDTPLAWGGVFSANPQIIRQLVTRGADVNFSGVRGKKPLHCLAGSSNHPTVMIPELIAQGANLEARDADDVTALHWATCTPNLSACKVLIASGADVNARAADGVAPVELALIRNGAGASEITAVLKNAGADLQLTDINGNTLLHRLVMQRKAEAIDVLLSNDVNVNVRNITSEPLFRLLERPAILEAARGRPDWPRFDTSKATPLHLAAAFGSDPKIIRALIKAGTHPK